MKRYLSLLLIVVLGFSFVGCTAAQGKSFDDTIKIIKAYADSGKEKTDKILNATGEALERMTKLITAAEKDEEPKLAEGDPVVDMVKKGADVAKPFLPFPFNLIVGLVPFGVAWLRARGRANKRTAEEALLIAGLQTLKKQDPEAFKKFIEYRDLAAKGLLTAKKTAELLEGINKIRAVYS